MVSELTRLKMPVAIKVNALRRHNHAIYHEMSQRLLDDPAGSNGWATFERGNPVRFRQ
jgi:hypothetical protein